MAIKILVDNSETIACHLFLYNGITFDTFKVLEKCTQNLIGHSRLAFNNHESNIDC